MPRTVERFTFDEADTPLLKWILCTFPPGSSFMPHTHYTLEISMILSGKGEYSMNGRIYPVQTGDIILFNNRERHFLCNTGDQPLKNAALEFEPRSVWTSPSSGQELLAVFFHRNNHFENRLSPSNPAYDAVRRQFLQIGDEFQHQKPYGKAVVKARLMGLLADLLRNGDLVDPPAAQSPYHTDMNAVLAYMTTHYAEPLSLEMLAGILHVAPSYFCRLFRASNGISPKEYLVKLRVEEAAHRLRTTQDGVLEIAQSCGFNSLSNFYTAFKRVMGKTPAQFRSEP